MKFAFAVFVMGVCLLAVAAAFPSNKEYELQPGIPTSLLEVENQQLSQTNGEEQSPLAREKRHKKKVIVINQYYGRPGYHGGYGQGQGCRGCGGYGGYSNYGGYGNGNYGHADPNYGYPYQGGYSGGHGHKFKG